MRTASTCTSIMVCRPSRASYILHLTRIHAFPYFSTSCTTCMYTFPSFFSAYLHTRPVFFLKWESMDRSRSRHMIHVILYILCFMLHMCKHLQFHAQTSNLTCKLHVNACLDMHMCITCHK